MNPRIKPTLQRGFTLIEIMVGMVIGMLGMVVMMQVFLAAEANKRTTGGTGDAQTNGTIALYTLQRDVRQAGYGVTALSISGCNLTLRTGVTVNVLAPLTINHASIPAGDANTDTLLVVYGNANGSPEGDVIALQPSTPVYSIATPTSFAVGDWVIAQIQTRPSPCTLLAEPVVALSTSVTVTTGLAGAVQGTLFNLGASPKVLAYAVRNGNLTVCDYMTSNCSAAASVTDEAVWAPIANGIVSMRLQYGRDTTAVSMDGIVDGYDQITPGSAADVSGFPLNCSIGRVLAARLAIVTRNSQMEKTAVTTAEPSWAGSAAAPINVSADPNWQNYRYRVFQTVIPLRNVVSLGAQSGC
jgi:type IV pilus assembly protein PilW